MDLAFSTAWSLVWDMVRHMSCGMKSATLSRKTQAWLLLGGRYKIGYVGKLDRPPWHMQVPCESQTSGPVLLKLQFVQCSKVSMCMYIEKFLKKAFREYVNLMIWVITE